MGSKIASVRSTSTASTAYELLSRANAANPTGTAITYIEDADTLSTSKLTHAEFIARLHQMAHLFRELGVGRNDVVSILSPNVTDALVAFFAAETVGIANPINFLLRSDEVEAMMRAVGSKVLVTIGFIRAVRPVLQKSRSICIGIRFSRRRRWQTPGSSTAQRVRLTVCRFFMSPVLCCSDCRHSEGVGK